MLYIYYFMSSMGLSDYKMHISKTFIVSTCCVPSELVSESFLNIFYKLLIFIILN